MRRCILIVLDSVGIGELPDAADFGDVGSNTLGHICETRGLEVPELAKMGLGRIRSFKGIPAVEKAEGSFGSMMEVSIGKDTTTGHWEMVGIESQSFTTYPNGFPPELLAEFKARTGLDVFSNLPASGTVVIKEFGQEHEKTGTPIVYTSADPVLQIAAHEDVISVERLYELCEILFDIAMPKYGISRVIARPFVGEYPNYTRTHHRRDFAVAPPTKSVLEDIVEAGLPVVGVGKIPQIYAYKGITGDIHTRNNQDGINKTLEEMARVEGGLIFTNLVDFDMLYGHRRNVQGYGDALEAFDKRLPELIAALKEDDLLILTADHGNDPTFPGTDHTREYVPVLAYGARFTPVDLGTRSTFADIGATMAEHLNLPAPKLGTSFWKAMSGLEEQSP